jgi:hypothetical protein
MEAVAEVGSGKLEELKRNIRDNARRWTAVAAGTGLTLGVMARLIRRRRRISPDIVVIEAC